MERVAVVTGASAGIGRSITERLRLTGWQVVGVDTADAATPDLAASHVRGDVTDSATYEAVLATVDSVGRLEAWINCAAIARQSPLHELDTKELDLVLEVNLKAVILASQVAVRRFLRDRQPGVLINISSIQARTAFPGWAAYIAAKGGVESFTRYVAVEYGRVGIRALAVAPGNVETDMFAQLPASVRDSVASMQPLGRAAQASEIASVVCFLASDEASFMTGQTITVDGGATARCVSLPTSGDGMAESVSVTDAATRV